jgi:thymidine kinase
MAARRKNRMPKEFVIYTGPMWSGKTTRLTAAVERHRIRQTEVLCFKPDIDGRYAASSIVTHSGSKMNALSVSKGEQILQHVATHRPEVIAVDEAFMIEGSAEALIDIFKRGVSVYVSSIELSANLKSFSEIEKMMPFATRVEKCTAVCVACGDDAALTHRRVPSLEEISVGGADSYEPMCWSCHPLASVS